MKLIKPEMLREGDKVAAFLITENSG